MDYEFPSVLESDALPANVHRDVSAVSGGSGCMSGGLMSARGGLHGVAEVTTGLRSSVCYMSHSCVTQMAAGVEVNGATVVATSVAHVD